MRGKRRWEGKVASRRWTNERREQESKRGGGGGGGGGVGVDVEPAERWRELLPVRTVMVS